LQEEDFCCCQATQHSLTPINRRVSCQHFFMKILVISDSHGKAKLLKQIITKVSADYVIHCGDFCTQEKELPRIPLTVVKGNCDFADILKEKIQIINGYRFLITHGHQYQVKTGLLSLKYRAQEVKANIVCFGHSHYPFCQQVDNILFINPGSITTPRSFPYPTYACLKIMEGQINVSYYKIDGHKISERGGSFRI
jgi:uncharacterized protein